MKKHGKYKILERVQNTFNLFEHGRSDGNGRGYLIDSVKKLIASPRYQERLKLGELYGYFGHNLRELTGKMDLAEVEVINFEGKPVVIETVPSNVHAGLEIDDDGNVTHYEDILDTPSGRAVKAMRDSGVGGWSWAVMGVPTAMGAWARSLHGFDFVKHPSYINVEKQQAMFESVGVGSEDELLERMFESAGFDAGQASKLIGILDRRAPSTVEYEAMTKETIMLESALASKETQLAAELLAKQQREERMFEALQKAPFFTSERQMQALMNMGNDEDLAIVKALFESIQASVSDLPLGAGGQIVSVKPKSMNPDIKEHAINMGSMGSPFSVR